MVGVLGYEISWRAVVKITLLGQAQPRLKFLSSGRNEVDLFASLQNPHRDDVAG